MEDYAKRYLFPFHRVPKGSRIVIYGAGKLGQEYARQVLATDWCQIIAMIDRNAEAFEKFIFPVHPIEDIDLLSFDEVVVAIRSDIYRKSVFSQLAAHGVLMEQVVYQETYPERALFHRQEEEENRLGKAECSITKSILLRMCGGFGDLLVQKKIADVLVELDPDIHIDVSCEQGKSFLQFLFEDMDQVKSINLLVRNQERDGSLYSCEISFDAMPSLHVVHLTNSKVFSDELEEVLHRLQELPQEHSSTYERIYLSIYRGETFYTRLACGGVVPFHRKFTHIPTNDNAIKIVREMNLGKYVTMNFGNGSAADASLIAKAWSQECFERVIRMVHEQYPGIQVVQVGARQAARLKNADAYVLGKHFSLAAEVLRHALLHIDIEGGLVHLATHLGTKCIVLFGPTQLAYYGYPENINIKAGRCHECYSLYNDVNRCARDMREPECMYSITPEMVMEAVRRYFNEQEGRF